MGRRPAGRRVGGERTVPGSWRMFAAAGLERGPVIAHRVMEGLGEEECNPWPAIGRAIEAGVALQGPAAGLVGRTAGKAWTRLVADPERLQQLRVMSRFALCVDQARRLFDVTGSHRAT